jgi:hypothetical protein
MVPSPIADRSECADVRRRRASPMTGGSLPPQSRWFEPPRYRKAELKVCKDELDNLILRAERGRSVLLGHLAIELDDMCHRSPDQQDIFRYRHWVLRICMGRNKNTVEGQRFASQASAKGTRRRRQPYFRRDQRPPTEGGACFSIIDLQRKGEPRYWRPQ